MMTSESRRGMRYEVQLPCQVFSPARAFATFSGVTQNMSRSGLLLALVESGLPSRLPEVGQAARIVLRLPQTATERRCIECLGRVVRVDRDSPSVAFEFRRYTFTGEQSGIGTTGNALLSS
jgi:hypothetical protein